MGSMMKPVINKVWVFDNSCSLRGEIFKRDYMCGSGTSFFKTWNPSKEVYKRIEEPTRRVSTRASRYVTDMLY